MIRQYYLNGKLLGSRSEEFLHEAMIWSFVLYGGIFQQRKSKHKGPPFLLSPSPLMKPQVIPEWMLFGKDPLMKTPFEVLSSEVPINFCTKKKTVKRKKAREDCRSFNLTRRKTPSKQKEIGFHLSFLSCKHLTHFASTARLTWPGDFSGWSILLAPPSRMAPHTYSNQNWDSEPYPTFIYLYPQGPPWGKGVPLN